MKVYHIYFSDYPEEFTKVICKNLSEARKKAKNYIKVWGLDAEILKIEYVKEFEG